PSGGNRLIPSMEGPPPPCSSSPCSNTAGDRFNQLQSCSGGEINKKLTSAKTAACHRRKARRPTRKQLEAHLCLGHAAVCSVLRSSGQLRYQRCQKRLRQPC